MTQRSRPQAGHINTYPVPSDPGPYSADQWSELFQVLFTGDQEATQGPLIRYLNELIVTNTTPTLTIGTGAGFCYGHWFINSALVTFNPSNVAREDRVVLVENSTNTAYDTNLEFPTVLTDYDAGDVPAYSCRLAILTGTGPAAPRALVNAGGINMVMLAHYDIDAGGIITGMTDERDFCKFSTGLGTRKFFVPATEGINNTDGGSLGYTSALGFAMIDAKVCTCWSNFLVPQDFVSGMTIKAVVTPAANGDLVCRNDIYYGACGEAYDTHTDGSGVLTIAVTQVQNCIATVTPANEAIDDIINVEFQRQGDNVADTVNDIVYFPGWIVEYTADS